jgi:DNA-binding response OmpR family regulator
MLIPFPPAKCILVVDDLDETRHLYGKMLRGSGYDVDLAWDEDDAVVRAAAHIPDLILMSLGSDWQKVVATGKRIREGAGVGDAVTMVVFCASAIPEGAEMEVCQNVYVTRPDNFDQLRGFLGRLLGRRSAIA